MDGEKRILTQQKRVNFKVYLFELHLRHLHPLTFLTVTLVVVAVHQHCTMKQEVSSVTAVLLQQL